MNNLHILLVEDEAPKRTHIQEFLQELAPGIIISIAKSVNSALDALDDELPDLLILDMSLPTFDVGERESGGRPQGFGGTEVLRNMAMGGIQCPTIVITGYEAFLRKGGKTVDLLHIREELVEEFPQIIMGVLHYNSTYEEWKTALKKALAEVVIPQRGDR